MQPGKEQSRSHSTSALRRWPPNSRVLWPRSRTAPSVPRTAGTRSASQASRRTAATPRGMSVSSRPWPSPEYRSGRAMVTTSCGLVPPVAGRSPPSRARRASSTSASPSRRRGLRVSLPSAERARGAASGSSAARTVAQDSGSRVPRSRTIPFGSSNVARPTDAARNSASASCRASRASATSGAMTSSRRSASRRSVLASNERAWSSRYASARRRRVGSTSAGSSATAWPITAACSTSISPAASAVAAPGASWASSLAVADSARARWGRDPQQPRQPRGVRGRPGPARKVPGLALHVNRGLHRGHPRLQPVQRGCHRGQLAVGQRPQRALGRAGQCLMCIRAPGDHRVCQWCLSCPESRRCHRRLSHTCSNTVDHPATPPRPVDRPPAHRHRRTWAGA